MFTRMFLNLYLDNVLDCIVFDKCNLTHDPNPCDLQANTKKEKIIKEVLEKKLKEEKYDSIKSEIIKELYYDLVHTSGLIGKANSGNRYGYPALLSLYVRDATSVCFGSLMVLLCTLLVSAHLIINRKYLLTLGVVSLFICVALYVYKKKSSHAGACGDVVLLYAVALMAFLAVI